MPPSPRSALDRFAEHVALDDNGCWIWIGKCSTRGYGQFRRTPSANYSQAHRWSYETFAGPIPDGLQLDHLCRVRACVNPAHLEPVTCRENLLRSPLTAARINAARTRCAHGHEFTAGNTYLEPTRSGRPVRRCRTCARIRALARYSALRDTARPMTPPPAARGTCADGGDTPTTTTTETEGAA